jgi:hypothetical protein
MFIVPIVEGHGEVIAIPPLLRKIAMIYDSSIVVHIGEPIRVKSGSFLNIDKEFSRFVNLAAEKAKLKNGTVIIIIDSEDFCPKELGPTLRDRARAIRPDVPIFISLAYREFETWFIYSIGSICKEHKDVNDATQIPKDPESYRDAKGWLTNNMICTYDPIKHQKEFVNLLDINSALNSRSFRRLYSIIGLCVSEAS